MNHRTDHDSLLTDVLAEAEPAQLRATLLGDTLRQVRRRSRNRIAARMTFAGAAVMAVTLWLGRAPGTRDIERCPIVHSRPLPTGALVTTRSFNPVQRVATQRFFASFHSLEGTAPVRLITDAELLALAGPRPAVLVRVSSREQTLIFADESPQ